MNTSADSDASGFSLIELTIALVVTLIITGAMYGLLAGGQSAFRREPELSDRQANIRVAMDLVAAKMSLGSEIMKDIGNAGSGLPPFAQVFTRNLDACAACNNGGAPMGLGGVRTDELEMLTNDGSRDNEPLCRNSTGWTNNAANIRLARNVGWSGDKIGERRQPIDVIQRLAQPELQFFTLTRGLRTVFGGDEALFGVGGKGEQRRIHGDRRNEERQEKGAQPRSL